MQSLEVMEPGDMNPQAGPSRRIRWSARIFTAWLALSVVFALTPCCDVYAAFVPGETHAVASDHATALPDHDGDDKPCAAWLDRNDALPAESGMLPTATPKLAIVVQFAFHLPSSRVTPPPFIASASPPDALYLRYLHLIL